jgi:hypothetical protein
MTHDLLSTFNDTITLSYYILSFTSLFRNYLHVPENQSMQSPFQNSIGENPYGHCSTCRKTLDKTMAE